MLGNYPEAPTNLLLMLKTPSKPLLISISKKLTEEMVNSPILIGLLTSSWKKLLPSVLPSEKELTITFMMKDLILCSTEQVMKTSLKEYGDYDQMNLCDYFHIIAI